MYIAPSSGHTSFNFNMPFKLILRRCEVVFLMSGVKILHFLKDWWKSIPIHQNYTMALMWNTTIDCYCFPTILPKIGAAARNMQIQVCLFFFRAIPLRCPVRHNQHFANIFQSGHHWRKSASCFYSSGGGGGGYCSMNGPSPPPPPPPQMNRNSSGFTPVLVTVQLKGMKLYLVVLLSTMGR